MTTDPNSLHAAELRSLGYSDDEIEDLLADISEESPDDVKRKDLRTTSRILRGLAKAGLYDGNTRTASIAIKLLERRAKYLGLDAPARSEVTGANGGPIHLDMTKLSDDELDRIARCGTGVGGDRAASAETNGTPGGLHPVFDPTVGKA